MATCELMTLALLALAIFLDNSSATLICMAIMFIICTFKYVVEQSETLATVVKRMSRPALKIKHYAWMQPGWICGNKFLAGLSKMNPKSVMTRCTLALPPPRLRIGDSRAHARF